MRDRIWWRRHRVGNVGRGIEHVGPDLDRGGGGELAVGDVDDFGDVDPVAGVFAVRRVLGWRFLSCESRWPRCDPNGTSACSTRWRPSSRRATAAAIRCRTPGQGDHQKTDTRGSASTPKHNAAVLGSCQSGNYLTPARLRDRRTGSRLLGTTVSSLPCATTPPWSPTRACSSRRIVSVCAPRSASRGIHRSGSRGEDRTDAVMTSSTSRRSFLLCPCASSTTRPLTVQGAVHFDRDADLAPNRRGAHPQQCVEVG